MDLSEVTRLERMMLFQMPVQEAFESRSTYMIKHGIYRMWQDIFKKHVVLALAGNTESLKRALFILWYECSEPSELSGIKDLDTVQVYRVLSEVDTLASNDKLDNELRFMLPFYFQICDWYVARFNNLSHLTHASKILPQRWQRDASKCNWTDRGIMGDYWSALILRHTHDT